MKQARALIVDWRCSRTPISSMVYGGSPPPLSSTASRQRLGPPPSPPGTTPVLSYQYSCAFLSVLWYPHGLWYSHLDSVKLISHQYQLQKCRKKLCYRTRCLCFLSLSLKISCWMGNCHHLYVSMFYRFFWALDSTQILEPSHHIGLLKSDTHMSPGHYICTIAWRLNKMDGHLIMKLKDLMSAQSH